MTADPRKERPPRPERKPDPTDKGIPPNGPRPGTDPERDKGKTPPDPSYIPVSGKAAI